MLPILLLSLIPITTSLAFLSVYVSVSFTIFISFPFFASFSVFISFILRLFLSLCFFYFSFLVSVSVLTLAPFPFFIAPPAVTVQSDFVALTLALHLRLVFISPLLFSLPSHSAPGIAFWLLSFSPYESPKG